MKTNVRLLRSCMTYNSLTEEDVRKAIGMDKATFSTRMEDGDFTISQIHKMMRYIPLALEDVCSIFFSDDWGEYK